MSTPLLELRGISKHFAGVAALQDVDLTLRAGQILAVLGENGAGKSTLMKILSGVHRPDAGIIRLDGRPIEPRSPDEAQSLGISIIYQEFSLVPHLDVVENLFLGRELTQRSGIRARGKMKTAAEGILEQLGTRLPLSSPVVELSVAEQQFVEIAKALLRQTRVLIMDEPTATLTSDETHRLFTLIRDLQRQSVGILFISHHLEEIFAIADDIFCLRDGRRVGERPVAGCSRDELIRLMVGRDIAQTYPERRRVDQAQPALLEVRHLQRKPHLPDVTFTVHAGEILGIAGLVGSGRTKMVRALMGADPAHRHEIFLNNQRLKITSPADALAAGIGLAPEDRKQQGLVVDASIQDNALFACLRRFCHRVGRYLRATAATKAVLSSINRLHIKATSVHQVVRTLSGGNQQKVVLAKWLNAGCRILIFDEPTRGIDVGAKAELYRFMRQLATQGLAIVMISSELPEIIGMSDRLMVMRLQRIAYTFDRGERATPERVIAVATGESHA